MKKATQVTNKSYMISVLRLHKEGDQRCAIKRGKPLMTGNGDSVMMTLIGKAPEIM